ncbi:MAG: glycine cleavage T C-terminal barrel domain-containing protein, partial [Pseudomonadota bacterium]
LCGFTVEATDADVIGDEPIFYDGSVVGWVTSGGFAHNAGLSMALGYVPKEHANQATGWAIEVLGEMLPARRQFAPVFDANAERMRG